MEGAEYERLMAFRHRRPPFRLFLSTQSKQVADEMCELHEKTPCLLDIFSLEFMAEHDIRSAAAGGDPCERCSSGIQQEVQYPGSSFSR